MAATAEDPRPRALKAAVYLLVGRALLGVAAFALPVEDKGEAQTMLVVGAVFVSLSLLLAYFVWGFRRWAAWGAIVLMGLDILLSLPIVVVGGDIAFILAGAVAVITAVAVIVLLRQRAVRSLLR